MIATRKDGFPSRLPALIIGQYYGGVIFMQSSKEELYCWYIEKRMSYRQIMERLGINNARKIKRLLVENEIPIRKGSDAVKTQWENNPERRKQQGNLFSKCNKGSISTKRVSDEDLAERLLKLNLRLNKRFFLNSYSYMEYECMECGYESIKTLKNAKGCPKCGMKKSSEKQKNDWEYVQSVFKDAGLILLDEEYINSAKPMKILCPNHSEYGIQKVSLEKQKNKKGCKYCSWDRMRKPTSDIREIRKSYKTSEWRKQVFERDSYTCQSCGDNKGKNLQAHHILNFSNHKEKRFDVLNGITLCQSCHNPSIKGSFHYIYGTKNNNYSQLKEYINTNSRK